VDQRRQRPTPPRGNPVRLGADKGQQRGVAHIQQKICELPKVQERVVGLPETYHGMVGNYLMAKTLREKCVSKEVRKMIGKVEDQSKYGTPWICAMRGRKTYDGGTEAFG
jgi:hypothetical protein